MPPVDSASFDTDVSNKPLHEAVMLREVLESLDPKAGETIVDCTVGMAGHATALAQAIGDKGRLIGIDQDEVALEKARSYLTQVTATVDLVHDNFRHVGRVLRGLKVERVDAMFFDLGISSFQLDDPNRGFSFNMSGPLDMRMNQEHLTTAFDLINALSEREISDILKNFGQERWHYKIARAIVHQRKEKPLTTTDELKQTVARAVGGRYRHLNIHPATRTFQALRIAVNRELEVMEQALQEALRLLNPGGRLCVISFHSLEDRIVKHQFRHWAKAGDVTLLVKKPVRPTDTEVEENPRSRSAKLRAVQRI